MLTARLTPVLIVAGLAFGQTTRNQRLQQDLDYFATQLPLRHVNAFHQVAPQQFSQAVSNLSASIPNITDQQFYVGMAAIAAMIGDAHTHLILENDDVYHSSAVANLGFLNFPIQLRWLDDGVFVEAAAPQYAQTIGTQLVALGTTSIADAVTALTPIISHENDQWLRWTAQHYLTSQQVLQALGVLPAGGTSQLTFQRRSGEQFTVTMTGGPPSALTSWSDQTPGFLPDYLQSANLNYWYTYLPSTRTLYFKYNVCEDMASLPFSTFAQGMLATLDQNPVDTFVFDFRQNGGGNGNLINALGAGLLQRLPALTKNPAFRIYGAIDKGTFSSGMDDAEGLKQPLPGLSVTLIGEPSGGKPGSFGEVRFFLLPNSGLEVDYATAFEPAVNVPDEPSLVPDIAVPIRSADFFARHDPVLAAIFGRASIPPPPSGNVITVSGASFRTEQGLAPGSIAAAFGVFPNGADEVRMNGQSAQIFAATPSVVVFLVPPSTNVGPAIVDVRLNGASVGHGNATVTLTSPGIFILNNFDPAQPGAVENPDYSVNNQATPVARGGFLQIYATGEGVGSPPPPSVYLGDIAVDILFSGAVAPGLWLLDVKVPGDFPYQGQIPVAIAAGGIVSNGATAWISK